MRGRQYHTHHRNNGSQDVILGEKIDGIKVISDVG